MTTGARPGVPRSIPHHRHLVADLHHRRPDVVEELNLHHRLELPRRHPDRAPDDAGFGEGGVEHSVVAVKPLQAVRQLEHPALAFDDRQRRGLTGIRDVLPEDDDARLARHFVLEGAVDRLDHGVGLAFGLRRRLERRRARIHVGRIEPQLRRALGRLRRSQGRERRLVHFAFHSGEDLEHFLVGGQAGGSQELGKADDWIALGFGLALGRRLVQPLIVRQRVRVGTCDFRVDERRSTARSHVRRRLAHRPRAREKVGAVDRIDVQAGKAAHQARDVAARSLHFYRHRDRVAVVFDEEQHRQAASAGDVDRLPEFALAGRSLAE